MADPTYTFKIYFFGLICHIGPNHKKKKHAAIVKTDSHFPVIMFDRDTIVPFIATKLEFVDLEMADATTDMLFQQYVPGLSQILGGQIDADVLDASDQSKAIYVRYPKGTLSVVSLYSKEAKHRLDDEDRRQGCVARMTLLTITTTKAAITVRGTGLEALGVRIQFERDVAADGCILIANISRDITKLAGFEAMGATLTTTFIQPDTVPAEHDSAHGVHGTSHDIATPFDDHPAHAKEFGRILSGEGDVSVEEAATCYDQVTPPQCDFVRAFLDEMVGAQIRTSIHPECGNTNWP